MVSVRTLTCENSKADRTAGGRWCELLTEDSSRVPLTRAGRAVGKIWSPGDLTDLQDSAAPVGPARTRVADRLGPGCPLRLLLAVGVRSGVSERAHRRTSATGTQPSTGANTTSPSTCQT